MFNSSKRLVAQFNLTLSFYRMLCSKKNKSIYIFQLNTCNNLWSCKKQQNTKSLLPSQDYHSCQIILWKTFPCVQLHVVVLRLRHKLYISFDITTQLSNWTSQHNTFINLCCSITKYHYMNQSQLNQAKIFDLL
jgi:hypothetical protein